MTTESLVYLDAGAPAFADGVGDSGPGGVNHGHEAHEAQLLRGEVHLLCVEAEAIGELVVGEIVMAEAWGRREKHVCVELGWILFQSDVKGFKLV